jgi:hypothetical protein
VHDLIALRQKLPGAYFVLIGIDERETIRVSFSNFPETQFHDFSCG